MDYRRFNDVLYIRMDRGDEIIATILTVCEHEGIRSATFSGIGGCGDAEIQVLDAARGVFETERFEGTLELVSLMGNVICDDEGSLTHHAHALFSSCDGDGPRIAAGHLRSSTVRYTAEIELRPVIGGVIGKCLNEETGTGFWKF